MPYLKKAEKPKKQKKQKKPKKPNLKKEQRYEIYHSMLWIRIRQNYIQHHPLCEICEAEGKSVLAQDVHHKDSFTHYVGDERLRKAFDVNNLMALCRKHHCELHKGNKTTYGFDMEAYLKSHPDEIL